MTSTATEPRPEQFGLTAADVERAPTAFIRSHRGQLSVGLWVLTLVTAFVFLLSVTRDVASSAFFAVIVTAAASIILVPLTLCLLSVGEHAENAWMRRRVPGYAACLAYRDAVTAHREAANRSARPRSDRWFSCARRAATRSEVGRALRARGFDVHEVSDPEASGYDLVVRDGDRTVLLRCLPGGEPADPVVGREMTGLMADHDAQAGIIVAAAGATPELVAYVERRQLGVVHPSRICAGHLGS